MNSHIGIISTITAYTRIVFILISSFVGFFFYLKYSLPTINYTIFKYFYFFKVIYCSPALLPPEYLMTSYLISKLMEQLKWFPFFPIYSFPTNHMHWYQIENFHWPPNNQNNLGGRGRTKLEILPSWIQNSRQSYSNQNSMKQA